MKKRILIIAITVIACAVAIGLFLFNKPRVTAAKLNTDIHIDATQLFLEYQKDESIADKKFVNKIIEVKGAVTDVQKTDSTLSIELKASDAGGINCSINTSGDKNLIAPKKGDVVNVKGRCSGFLMDVNLTDCVIEN